MRKCRLSLIAALLGGAVLGFSPRVLAGGAASTKALEEQVEALTRKVQTLERRLEQQAQQSSPARTQEPPPAVVEALDQKVKILERRWEIDQEAAAAKAKEAPILGAGRDGFSLKSADGSFQLRCLCLQVSGQPRLPSNSVQMRPTSLFRTDLYRAEFSPCALSAPPLSRGR